MASDFVIDYCEAGLRTLLRDTALTHEIKLAVMRKLQTSRVIKTLSERGC